MENLCLMIIPITAGLVEGIKKNFDLDGKFYFLFSVLISLGLSILIRGFTVEAIVFGLRDGLASSGLYSGLKATLDNSSQEGMLTGK